MFASVLLELAREQGFKGLIADDGATALALAHRYKPHAITLDIGLPDMDGWALLDLLKHDPRTRHVPIHVISVDDQKKRGLQAGAFGFLEKPVDRDALMEALSRTQGVRRPAGQERCSSSRTTTSQRMSIAELLGDEAGRGDRRRHGRGGARGDRRPGASTAPSSISACPTCPAPS